MGYGCFLGWELDVGIGFGFLFSGGIVFCLFVCLMGFGLRRAECAIGAVVEQYSQSSKGFFVYE